MRPVIIVGAGIAGLVAAIELHRAGRSVMLFEAAPEVGGRVRSTVRDGFTLDHGFQVLFTAYPVLNSYLDHAALSLCAFSPAARIVDEVGTNSLVGDALRDPSLMLPSLTGGAMPLADLWRMLQLRRFATSLGIDECLAAPFGAITTKQLLEHRGFSRRAIDSFFAPFYGGILLDRTLSTRASVLLFTFKMLAEGQTAVPSRGMGQVAAQLARQLPAGAVRCNAPVRSLNVSDGRIGGVTLDDGSVVAAQELVLATDLVSARALASTVHLTLHEPRDVLGCTTVYYSASSAPLPGRALWLNAAPNATVSHAITLTEVASTYAPPGQHLLAATVLGDNAMMEDDALDAAVRGDLAIMAPRGALPTLHRVAVWRVPFAQFAQPVGNPSNAKTETAIGGLWRAGEVLHSSSLEGAARGGQMAARALLGR